MGHLPSLWSWQIILGSSTLALTKKNESRASMKFTDTTISSFRSFIGNTQERFNLSEK
jgi:hypothetical protein